ncbi:MAG: uracil-DNA glycosylase [Alphaproteobacteria bacterium]|nr:uracil-DNA glycosylase [Rhodospirillales bacterium]MCW9045718.1 uracil-DNA glycosylase [Alphaproteobacteria bacterium]
MINQSFEPAKDCGLCPRLVEFRMESREAWPDWFNSPVPAFGSLDASLLVVGLAPGLKGANRTGRPFTGDYAGDLLYPTLIEKGFAKGNYDKSPTDGLELTNARITNAVRCVPPQNKPTGPEAKSCLPFLIKEIEAMPNLKILLALGTLAHNAVLTAFELKKSAYKFGHNAFHPLENGLILANSYHCSRYNTNTGRLTTEMFHDVFDEITRRI